MRPPPPPPPPKKQEKRGVEKGGFKPLFNASIPPGVDFGTLFDMHFAADPNPLGKTGREKGVMSPSHGLTMEYACHRQVVLKLLDAPTDPVPAAKTNLEMLLHKTAVGGDLRHDFLQHRFSRMAEEGWMGIREVYNNVVLRHPFHRIRGEADTIVRVGESSWYLLDFKTIGKAKAEKLVKSDEKYQIQLNTYMGLAGIKTAYLLYEVRDDFSFVRPADNFRVDFSNTLWDSTLKLAETAQDHARKRSLPVLDETACKRHLTYCKYTLACKAEQEGGDWLKGCSNLRPWGPQ